MRHLAPIAMFVLAGCGMFDFLSRSQVETLRRNRDRWEALQIRDYDYEYHRICYCAPDLSDRVRVEVRGGNVSRAVNLRTGGDVTALQYATWPTVDSLFAWTERSFRGGYKLQIIYDGTYHFPGSVQGDIPLAVDDEFTQVAERLVRR